MEHFILKSLGRWDLVVSEDGDDDDDEESASANGENWDSQSTQSWGQLNSRY